MKIDGLKLEGGWKLESTSPVEQDCKALQCVSCAGGRALPQAPGQQPPGPSLSSSLHHVPTIVHTW